MSTQEILNLALSFIGGCLTLIAARIAADLGRLTKSVEHLNVNMAKMLERVQSHEKRIKRLEDERGRK